MQECKDMSVREIVRTLADQVRHEHGCLPEAAVRAPA